MQQEIDKRLSEQQHVGWQTEASQSAWVVVTNQCEFWQQPSFNWECRGQSSGCSQPGAVKGKGVKMVDFIQFMDTQGKPCPLVPSPNIRQERPPCPSGDSNGKACSTPHERHGRCKVRVISFSVHCEGNK